MRSTKHVSSQVAVGLLTNVLSTVIYNNLPSSPQNWCTGGNNGAEKACFSWSQLSEDFGVNLAVQMLNDAITSDNLDMYSVYATATIGNRKRW